MQRRQNRSEPGRIEDNREDHPLCQHLPLRVACRLLPGVEVNWVPWLFFSLSLFLLIRQTKGLRIWWALSLFSSIPGVYRWPLPISRNIYGPSITSWVDSALLSFYPLGTLVIIHPPLAIASFLIQKSFLIQNTNTRF